MPREWEGAQSQRSGRRHRCIVRRGEQISCEATWPYRGVGHGPAREDDPRAGMDAAAGQASPGGCAGGMDEAEMSCWWCR